MALVDPDDAARESLKKLLLGMDRLWLEAECSRYEFFSDVVAQTNPDIGVVGVDHNPRKALQLIEELRQTSPQCAILVVSRSTDGQLILQAMRAGVREFLTLPVGVEELMAALERISGQSEPGSSGRARRSNVIAVAGATGGVGATSLAVNLGCVLAARAENSVVLVDLDLALGDADVFLDTIPEHTLIDVAQNASRLDFSLLRRALTRHASGLYLLPRPIHLQEAQQVAPEDLQRVLGLLKATFSHLLIDLSKSYSPLDLQALKVADQVLLVTQLDLPCLRNVVRLLASLEELDEQLQEKIKVVVNRVGLGSNAISLRKAQETIGREIFWQIPNDYRAMIEVRNNGVPLTEQAPKASVTQSLVSLAEALSGQAPAESEVTAASLAGRWLSFWPGKAKVPGGG
ncbi:MAG: AAA family ATPase [Pirellulaceae bacterium]|nr:AAA family ATPase [Pirellulaceae bacterium]